MTTELHTAFVRTRLTPLSAQARAVFVDEGGTLIEDRPNDVDPARVGFLPHALDALGELQAAGFQVIVLSQRPGLGRGTFPRAALSRFHAVLVREALAHGVDIDAIHVCPHAPAASPAAGCLCRFPAPGLLRQAARSHGLDLVRSWVIGDTLDHVEAGRRAGCRSVLLDVGRETEWRLSPLRQPHLRRSDWPASARAIVEFDAARAGEDSGPGDLGDDGDPRDAKQRSASTWWSRLAQRRAAAAWSRLEHA
jgi:histidinol-phosphate phosphatase family protein